MKEKYVDPDDLIEFKEVTLRITQKEFDEWSSSAKSKILKYLDKQASSKPWWDKRCYNL